MRVLLSGYYGFENAGDDALLLGIIAALKEIEFEPVVLSADPSATVASFGVEAVDRWNKRAIREEIAKADLVASGGGSLFQDVTGWRTPLYYALILLYAKFKKKKTLIFSQGVGPLRRRLSRMLARWVFSSAEACFVRDRDSLKLLQNMGIDSAVLTADPVFLLDRSAYTVDDPVPPGQKKQKKTLLVCLRDWPGLAEKLPTLAAGCRKFTDACPEYKIKLLPLQKDNDEAIAEQLASHLPETEIRIGKDVFEILTIFSEADLVLGMRLHSLIFAVLYAHPAVAIPYDPKVVSFANENGLHLFDYNKDDENKLYSLLVAEAENYELRKTELELRAKENRARAALPAEYLKTKYGG